MKPCIPPELSRSDSFEIISRGVFRYITHRYAVIEYVEDVAEKISLFHLCCHHGVFDVSLVEEHERNGYENLRSVQVWQEA